MAYIKLLKLTASGPDNRISTIEFAKKATIIAGPSDTGKTCIFKCIDYVLGASNEAKHEPFDEADGYTTINLLMDTVYGHISLTREQGSNKTYVSCKNQEIENGEYLLKATKNNSKTINNLMLKILGLKEDLIIPKSTDGKPAKFTWRTLKKAFFVDEKRADQNESILLPADRGGDTLYLAGLIYFLTNNDLSTYLLRDEPKEIKEAKKNAIITYITSRRQNLLKEKNDLSAELSAANYDIDSLSKAINELNQQMLDTNIEIEQRTEETTNASAQLIQLQTKHQKNLLLSSNYDTLMTDYQQEVARLSFIVQHELKHKNIKPNTKCPYCNNDIVPKPTGSYIEASRVELRRVITNLNELEETSTNLKNTLSDEADLIKVYEETIASNQNKLAEVLLPQRQKIAATLQSYEKYIRLQSAIDQLEETDKNLSEDMENYNKGKDLPRVPFNAKKIFYELIGQYIKDNGLTVLNEMGYANATSIDFLETKLDLVINDKQKDKRGKGYKSYINSVLLMLFRKFIEEQSVNKIGLFIFDSPLKNLSIPEEADDDTDNIRKGFFNYIVNLKTDDQIIVFENTTYRELPALDENEDTKIYIFTQNEASGRYGFLDGVKKV